jgi:flagellar motor switch protein FliN/FliY
VTQSVEYEQFDPTPTPPAGDYPSDLDLSRLSDIPMGLSVEIGRTHMTVAETLALRVGSVVTLDRQAGEAVDLLVNGAPIARGEVIVVDDRFALHVTELLAGHEIAASAAPEEATSPQAQAALASDGVPLAGD